MAGSTIPKAGAIGALGLRGGSSGAINYGASVFANAGAIGSLGSVGGSGGAITRQTGSGLQSTALGATRGSSGAVTPQSGGGLQSSALGATRGSGGSITPQNGGGLQSSALGARSGNNGAIAPQSGGGLQSAGLGARSGNSGAINTGKSVFPNAGAIGALGATGGNRGAISPQNGGGLQSTGLGARSGSDGAINRGKSVFPNAGAIGGLGGRSGSSGAIKSGGGSGLSGGGLGGGSRGVGGGSPSRSRPAKVPVYRHIYCGSPVSGVFLLDVEQSYDPATGLLLPDKINAWKAEVNGKAWTPEDYRDYLVDDNELVLADEETSTRRSKDFTGTWSANCRLSFDMPDPTGKIIDVHEVDLTIPNASTTTGSGDEAETVITRSNEQVVTNSMPGTGIFAQRIIYLPG